MGKQTEIQTKMKRIKSSLMLCLAIFAMALAVTSCKENIDTSARYVFKFNTILSYLEKHEAYSEYVDLLNKVAVSEISDTKVASLMSARGHYTCFAPSNEAIHKYLEELYQKDSTLMTHPSWDGFTDSAKLDSIRKIIVFNSIIDGGLESEAYTTAEFPVDDKAEFVMGCLNDKKLAVHYIKNQPDSIYINMDCPISVTQRDIICLNGVIHMMEKAIAPSGITCSEYITDYLEKNKEGYRVCFRALKACGLLDTLNAVRDEKYERLYLTNQIPNLEGMTDHGFAEGSIGYVPKHRLYGFTIFAETDDFWRNEGLDPFSDNLLQDLTQWILDNKQYSEGDVFVTDENYKSEKNLLYQWITYHMLPMRIQPDRLVFHINEYGFNINNPTKLTIPVMEYYTSMGPRRMFKLYESKQSNGVFINRFANRDVSRRGNGEETTCDPDKVGCRIMKESDMAILNDIENACIYPIDAPLAYTDATRDNLMRTRIRFDGMSMMPEAMNNDIRLKRASEERYKHVHIPNTVNSYNYFENMIQNDQTKFVYYNAWNDDWCNLNRDEMKAVGRWEITFKLPPVPKRGTYELRYEVLATGKRGVAQMYFGTDLKNLPVTGIPVDLTMSADNRFSGWERDTDDDDYNAEIDKRMRNNGYMKGSQAIDSNDGTERGYNDRANIRHIIVRKTLDPNETYYLKIKSVLDSEKTEFYMDYLEYCAKEVYDNPEVPEDIW